MMNTNLPPKGLQAGNFDDFSGLNRHKVHALFDSVSQFLWVTDNAGVAKFEQNSSWVEYTGQTQEEFERLGWVVSIHPEDREHTMSAWKRALASSSEYKNEYRIRRRDGEYRHFLSRGIPVKSSDGKVLEWVGSCMDITYHKQVENSLLSSVRESGLLRESLVRITNCPDLDSALICLLEEVVKLGSMDGGGIYHLDGENALLKYHQGLESDFVEKVVIQPLSTPYIRYALENPDEILDVTNRFPAQDDIGKLFHIQHLFCVPLSIGKAPFGFLIIFSRSMEAPNAKSQALIRILTWEAGAFIQQFGGNQRWRSVLNAMAEGVVLRSSDGKIIDCNPSAERILGLSRAQMMGLKSVDPRWRALHEDRSPFPGVDHPAMVTLRTGQPCNDVIMVIHLPDGTERWLNINSQPMFYSKASKPYAAVTTFDDITERRRLQDYVHQNQKLEGLGHLAGGVAHEFNNILAALLPNTELVKDSTSEPETREAMNEMQGLINRAATLVRQMLAFSRKSRLQLETLDLVQEIPEELNLLKRLLGAQIELNFTSHSDFAWVNADKSMISTVLMNLCLNARDAMEKGGKLNVQVGEIKFEGDQLSMNPEARVGNFVYLSVRDNGCGMDETVLSHLFEPFYTTKPVGKGTGLGLATVQGMVQQNQGWLVVESIKGEGSEFRVYLPATATAGITASV